MRQTLIIGRCRFSPVDFISKLACRRPCRSMMAKISGIDVKACEKPLKARISNQSVLHSDGYVLGALLPGHVPRHKIGYCEFPEFLWEPREDGREQIWFTKALYNDVNADWTSRQEVKVNPTQYVVTLATRTPCVKESVNISYHCVEKRVYQSVICLSEEPQHKYRVQIQRNGAIDSLQTDIFVTAKEQREWSFCPIDGGFDFTAKLNGIKKRVQRGFSEAANKETTAYFYYSPVCPLRGRGRPPNNVHYAEMYIQRTAGRCTSSAAHKFANYCKKSCGLCGHSADLVPSLGPECYFPKDWRGDWLWYETDRVEDVKIGPGQVSFSHLGSFICKGKHWLYKQYKMMSHYSNGCRPRYTCMQFRKDQNILKFQISRSNIGDHSFGLCKFEDDPSPLRNTIRSANMKLLLCNCGLSGQLDINVTFPVDAGCTGIITDWDSGQCREKGALHLSVYPCDKFNWKDVPSRKCHISQRSSSVRTERPKYTPSGELSVGEETLYQYRPPTRASKADRIRDTHQPGRILRDPANAVRGKSSSCPYTTITSVAVGVLFSLWLSNPDKHVVACT
ncbi:hypothetical protein LSH36_3g19134 [Paralvinella palmiformis]|uniref:DUF7043 domain-containing protein n=1 Tax=Paralvinella palmiformis TaxID=53620 RepID=A0AAD9NJA0_9ANNE|nr:hypothetical protein LSH36_3g19134 [Paralvinella palmiformis]